MASIRERSILIHVYDFKSIGNSTTLPKDVANQHELLAVLKELSNKVSERMKKKSALTTNISVTIRYKDRKTITRSRKLENPIVKANDITAAATVLFLEHWNGNAVRLLGVTGQDLVEEEEALQQLDLFSYEKEAKKEPLYNVIEQLRTRFGKDAVIKGLKAENIKKTSGADTSFNKDFLYDKSSISIITKGLKF